MIDMKCMEEGGPSISLKNIWATNHDVPLNFKLSFTLDWGLGEVIFFNSICSLGCVKFVNNLLIFVWLIMLLKMCSLHQQLFFYQPEWELKNDSFAQKDDYCIFKLIAILFLI